MRYITRFLFLALIISESTAQGVDTTSAQVVDTLAIPEPATLDLQFLIAEAMMNNPEIEADAYRMDVMEAKVPQARSLDDPELTFMREEMPGFRWNEATYQDRKSVV